MLGTKVVAQPFAATQAPGPITETTATLNGMATPNGAPTIAWFEWGTDLTYGQQTSPVEVGAGPGVVRVSAAIGDLSAGAVYHCRLVSSNTLAVAYGADHPFTTAGILVAWSSAFGGWTNTPRWLERAVDISAGGQALALKTNGKVVMWGSDPYPPIISNYVAGLQGIMAIAAGEVQNLALRTDGTVAAWGMATNVPASLGDIVAVAAGTSHGLALKADGTVVAWGSNTSHQTNVPGGLTNVVAIASGGSHSLALRADGQVIAWGSNSSGQTNVPVGLTDVVAVAGGSSHSLALQRDGTIVAWGPSGSPQTRVPAGLTNAVALAAGGRVSMALKADGTAVVWGDNMYGQTRVPAGLTNVVALRTEGLYCLALRGRTPSESVPYVATQSAAPVTASAATLNGMAAPNGSPTTAWFEWGTDASYGQTTAPHDVGSELEVVRVAAPITGLSSGAVYHCRLVASNTFGLAYGKEVRFTTGLRVAAWGDSRYGSTFVPPGTSPAVAVAAGYSHSLAVQPGGALRAWGSNAGGQLDIPSDLSEALVIAGGNNHTLALKPDGTVVGWGVNTSGQSTPPPNLTNVVDVAAGAWHSLALKADGTVVAWGYSTFGGTNVPAGLNEVVALGAGSHHSLALRADGSVVAWGANSFRQCAVPADLRNVVAIASGDFFSLALKSDGTVVAWGSNSGGQTNVPAGLTNVLAIDAGVSHCLALLTDGTVVVWGNNTYGQATVPAGLSGVAAIACGGFHCLALAPNAPPRGIDLTISGAPNQDLLVLPPCLDPNGDPLTYRVVSLPAVGSLYQFAPEGRGAAITAADTPVSDTQGRVIFVPAPDAFGVSYASFSTVASDGQFESSPGTVTVLIVPPPALAPGSYGPNPEGTAFRLSFTGLSNATYSAWLSADLSRWTPLGAASQPTPGQFFYEHIWRTPGGVTNWAGPTAFYQIRSP